MKHYIELKYKVNGEALREESKQKQGFGNVADKLRDALMKYWMMAHTSSPQFLLRRSVSWTASGAFCVLSTLMLLEGVLRLVVIKESLISFWIHNRWLRKLAHDVKLMLCFCNYEVKRKFKS
ncbi:hypothetical protein RYX36_023706 [Vicia faba]